MAQPPHNGVEPPPAAAGLLSATGLPAPVTSLQGTTVVYGGSFDPPHMAHQMACLYLLEALEADQVWLVPTFLHAFGKGLADFASRAAMCELLVAPFKGRVQVLDTERHLGGQSLTHATMTHLAQAHPGRRLALALGADIMADTHRWHMWDEINRRWPVAVVGRTGFPHPLSRVELPAIASRAVRDRVRQNKSLIGLVPASIARFIAEHRLYTDVPEP